MNELRQVILDRVKCYTDYKDDAERLTSEIMELIEPTIFDERRAAAANMRERCTQVAHNHVVKVSWPQSYTAQEIAEEIEALPLDSNGGG